MAKTTARTKSRLRSKQKELTLRLLRQAARSLFHKHAYEDVSMEDIAREAGVSRGTVYLHFPSKLDVLSDLLRDNLADQMGIYDELARSRLTTVGEMREWLQRFHEQMMRRGPLLHLHMMYFQLIPGDFSLVVRHRETAIAKLGAVYPGFDLSELSDEAYQRKRIACYLMLFQIEQVVLNFSKTEIAPDLVLGLDMLAEQLVQFAAGS